MDKKKTTKNAVKSKNRRVFRERINHLLLLFSLPAMDKQQRLVIKLGRHLLLHPLGFKTTHCPPKFP